MNIRIKCIVFRISTFLLFCEQSILIVGLERQPGWAKPSLPSSQCSPLYPFSSPKRELAAAPTPPGHLFS
ncbi:unknown protein [Desulfotalea psychrophila LSv54]|uniref:Uncharacterized protein n=1 Tax=Desulfotalea psychrophila (strain LSv54 / DSM 12343) TaxID=177439 RepID=Q6AK35_DESPS|nr:unknown protein [Desulfotalea psychrophila LSv54]